MCLQASLAKSNTAVFTTTVFVLEFFVSSPKGVYSYIFAAAGGNVSLWSTGPLFLHTLTHQRSTRVLWERLSNTEGPPTVRQQDSRRIRRHFLDCKRYWVPTAPSRRGSNFTLCEIKTSLALWLWKELFGWIRGN